MIIGSGEVNILADLPTHKFSHSSPRMSKKSSVKSDKKSMSKLVKVPGEQRSDAKVMIDTQKNLLA